MTSITVAVISVTLTSKVTGSPYFWPSCVYSWAITVARPLALADVVNFTDWLCPPETVIGCSS
ncbi:hypothetical protein SHIRM173S_00608 [Streptomyces hirsutus]